MVRGRILTSAQLVQTLDPTNHEPIANPRPHQGRTSRCRSSSITMGNPRAVPVPPRPKDGSEQTFYSVTFVHA
jgi:hypothetical protein